MPGRVRHGAVGHSRATAEFGQSFDRTAVPFVSSAIIAAPVFREEERTTPATQRHGDADRRRLMAGEPG